MGGPTYASSSAGVGTESPICSNVAARVAVMPGAESTIVPSRSNSTAVYRRGTRPHVRCVRAEAGQGDAEGLVDQPALHHLGGLVVARRGRPGDVLAGR